MLLGARGHAWLQSAPCRHAMPGVFWSPDLGVGSSRLKPAQQRHEAAVGSGRIAVHHRLAYSFAAMKPTIFDSSCICRTILPTSSFGNLVSERRMR
jgi:hypothetical protein